MPKLTDRINLSLICGLVMRSSIPTFINSSDFVYILLEAQAHCLFLRLCQQYLLRRTPAQNSWSNSSWLKFITIVLFKPNEAHEANQFIFQCKDGIEFCFVRMLNCIFLCQDGMEICFVRVFMVSSYVRMVLNSALYVCLTVSSNVRMALNSALYMCLSIFQCQDGIK